MSVISPVLAEPIAEQHRPHSVQDFISFQRVTGRLRWNHIRSKKTAFIPAHFLLMATPLKYMRIALSIRGFLLSFYSLPPHRGRRWVSHRGWECFKPSFAVSCLMDTNRALFPRETFVMFGNANCTLPMYQWSACVFYSASKYKTIPRKICKWDVVWKKVQACVC